MGDDVRRLPVDGDPPVRFTNTALAMAERLTGRTVPQLAAQLAVGQFSIDMVNRIAVAGLEGARLKQRTGGKEWKLRDVEELIEAAVDGGASFEDVATPLIDAFADAMRKWFPEEEEPADPPTAAGIGTGSSEPPSEPG